MQSLTALLVQECTTFDFLLNSSKFQRFISMKNVMLLLSLMLLSSLELYSQKKISKEYLQSIHFKQEMYDFQFTSLTKALKYPNPDKVYELYIKGELYGLKSLPKEIFKFKNLQVLIIEEADIQTIQNEISKLKNLEVLILEDANIVALPATIGELQKLKYLDLSYNKLESLPNSITQLKELEEIYLRNNPLSYFPVELLNLPKLRTLHWGGNSCALIPLSIGLDILKVSSNCDAYPFLEPHFKSKPNPSQGKDKKGN